MTDPLRFQIYYHLRTLYQDICSMLSTTAANLASFSQLHEGVRMRIRNQLMPLLTHDTLTDDTDIQEIEGRLTATSKEVTKALEILKGVPAEGESGQKGIKRSKLAEIEMNTSVANNNWRETIKICANIIGAYVHQDLVSAMDRVVHVLYRLSAHPEANTLEVKNVPLFIGSLASYVENEKIPSESPDYRAILAIISGIQTANVRVPGVMAQFLREKFATVTLLERLQGNPNQVRIQNLCANCGRVIDAPAYYPPSRKYTCSQTEAGLYPERFIQRCNVLAEQKDRNPNYLAKEMMGVRFVTPASFVAWSSSENYATSTIKAYASRVTPVEMCHLSRNGHLGRFLRIWEFLPDVTRLRILNSSQRGHHVDAFPDLDGLDRTFRLEITAVTKFVTLSVPPNSAAFKQITPPKRRLVSDDITTFGDSAAPISSSSAPISSSSAPISSNEVVDSGVGKGEGEEEEEEVKVYTRYDVARRETKPEIVSDRDIQKRVDVTFSTIVEDARLESRFVEDDEDREQKKQERNILYKNSSKLLEEVNWDEPEDESDDDDDDNSSSEDESMEVSEDEAASEDNTPQPKRKHKTVDDIRDEIEAEENANAYGVFATEEADLEVRPMWSFSFRDMKNALLLLVQSRFTKDPPPSQKQLSTLVQLFLYHVFPPSNCVLHVKSASSDGGVQVLLNQYGALNQHSRLFERRLEEAATHRDPIGKKKKVDLRLMQMTTVVMNAAAGVGGPVRKELLPLAKYLANVSQRGTAWNHMRQGNLSDFFDERFVLGSELRDKEHSLAEAMDVHRSYATGLFQRKSVVESKSVDDFFATTFSGEQYILVKGISNGILPPPEDEDAWENFAESPPLRLGSMMRVLGMVFGGPDTIYFSKGDWLGILSTTEALIRMATSSVFTDEDAEAELLKEGEVDARKLRRLRRFEINDKSETVVDSFGVQWRVPTMVKPATSKLRVKIVDKPKDYKTMASTMLQWVSSLIPLDLRFLKSAAWHRPYRPEIMQLVKKKRILYGLGPGPLDSAANKDPNQRLVVPDEDEVKEDEDEDEDIDMQITQDQTTLLLQLRADIVRYISKQRASTREEKTAAQQQLFGGSNISIEDLIEYSKLWGNVNNERDRARFSPDEIAKARARLEALERDGDRDRIRALGEWVYTKRRLLADDFGTEQEEKELYAALQSAAEFVIPGAKTLRDLREALTNFVQELDEITRQYVTTMTDRQLAKLVTNPEATETSAVDFDNLAVVYDYRNKISGLEPIVGKAEDMLVKYAVKGYRSDAETTINTPQRIKLSQRLLFAVCFMWPVRGVLIPEDAKTRQPVPVIDHVPTSIVHDINEEYKQMHGTKMEIVDQVVAEFLWSSTPLSQLVQPHGVGYIVSVTGHTTNLLADIAQKNLRRASELFLSFRGLGYPWQADDISFVLTWGNANEPDITLECLSTLFNVCGTAGNTRLRQLLFNALDEADLDRVYRRSDPRRLHTRMRESVLARIPLSDREIEFIITERWQQLGPDELSNFPKLTDSQLSTAMRVVGILPEEKTGAILNMVGIHKLYVFSRLVPYLRSVFTTETNADPFYRFIRKDNHGMRLAVGSKSDFRCMFNDLPEAYAVQLIAKVCPGGPFFEGARNNFIKTYYIGTVKVPESLFELLNPQKK